MTKPRYPYTTSADGHFYFFESYGNATIAKAVGYLQRDEGTKLVELVFGDLTSDNLIDVMAVSNNNDLPLVLNTVIGTLIDYLTHNPDHTIFFQGSTLSRTRLYRAAIAKALKQTELSYEVLGILDSYEVVPFVAHQQYVGYLIRSCYDSQANTN